MKKDFEAERAAFRKEVETLEARLRESQLAIREAAKQLEQADSMRKAVEAEKDSVYKQMEVFR